MSHQIARLVRRPRRPVALDDARPQLSGTTAGSQPARYKVRSTVTGPTALV